MKYESYESGDRVSVLFHATSVITFSNLTFVIARRNWLFVNEYVVFVEACENLSILEELLTVELHETECTLQRYSGKGMIIDHHRLTIEERLTYPCELIRRPACEDYHAMTK